MPSRSKETEKPEICKTCINKDSSIDIYPCHICKTRILDAGSEDCYEKENKNMEKDNINPDHYKNSTSLECIEAMEIIFGWKAVFDFCACNAWKYVWRWKNKNGLEDLKKAKWYVEKAAMLCVNNKGFDDIDHAKNELDVLDGLDKYIDNTINKIDHGSKED